MQTMIWQTVCNAKTNTIFINFERIIHWKVHTRAVSSIRQVIFCVSIGFVLGLYYFYCTWAILYGVTLYDFDDDHLWHTTNICCEFNNMALSGAVLKYYISTSYWMSANNYLWIALRTEEIWIGSDRASGNLLAMRLNFTGVFMGWKSPTD